MGVLRMGLGAWTMAVLGMAACGSFGATETPPDGEPTTEDASAPADDAAPSHSLFCQSVSTDDLLFCDSFDDLGIERWRKVDSDQATEFGVELDGAVSPPAWARCTILPGNNNSQDARLGFRIQGTKWIEVRGVVHVADRDLTQSLQFMALLFADNVFRARVNGSLMSRTLPGADAQSEQVLLVNPVPTSRTVPFMLRVDRRNKTVSFQIDGKGQDTVVPTLSPSPSVVSIEIGPAEAMTKHGWTMLFDNIVVRGGN